MSFHAVLGASFACAKDKAFHEKFIKSKRLQWNAIDVDWNGEKAFEKNFLFILIGCVNNIVEIIAVDWIFHRLSISCQLNNGWGRKFLKFKIKTVKT